MKPSDLGYPVPNAEGVATLNPLEKFSDQDLAQEIKRRNSGQAPTLIEYLDIQARLHSRALFLVKESQPIPNTRTRKEAICGPLTSQVGAGR